MDLIFDFFEFLWSRHALEVLEALETLANKIELLKLVKTQPERELRLSKFPCTSTALAPHNGKY